MTSLARATVVAVLAAVLASVGSVPPVAADVCGAEPPTAAYAERIAVSPGHAQVWRQYQAFYLRQPDESGLAYWYGQRARGLTLSDIAYSFSTSDEFQARYGELTDAAFVDLVYENVLCRTPDDTGRQYWVSRIRSGEVTRWDMVVYFAELREYLARTGTCHSTFPAEDAAAGCPAEHLVPLDQASLTTHGYRSRTFTVPRVGGGAGTLRGTEVDITRGLLRTSAQRCAVSSINANWVAEHNKDSADPDALGIGMIDGVHAKGSGDRMDRGVLGLRFDPEPVSNTESWPGDTGAEHRQRISSVLHHDGWQTIDAWIAPAEQSPYLQMRAPEQFQDPDAWVWAIAGMVFILNGQTNESFDADYVNDPYTNQTHNHAVVAFDHDTGVLFYGATSTVDTRDLVRWAEANGYEELHKFDGGGSTEYNIAGQAVVAGTPRAIPVWFGIGC